jgi:hypothetical protein
MGVVSIGRMSAAQAMFRLVTVFGLSPLEPPG